MRRHERTVVAAGLAAALSLGCVETTFAPGQFLCDQASPQSCPPGQSCGVDGRCHPPEQLPDAGGGGDGCVPSTCADLLPSCAAGVPDGCGGDLDCSGACPAPSTCGGEGVPDRCGCAVASERQPPGRVENVDYGQLDNLWVELAGAREPGDGEWAHTERALEGVHSSDYLVVTEFGFSIPADATILGLRLSFIASRVPEPTSDSEIRDQSIALLSEQGPSTPRVDTRAWPLTDTERSYGSDEDRWDGEWTPTWINGADFGARIQAESLTDGEAATPRVDYVAIEVFYRPACHIVPD